MSRRAVQIGWVVGLALGGWLLVHMGHGPLTTPSSVRPSSLRQWWSSHDAATAMMSVLRLVSLVLDGYLLVTTVAGAGARAARCARAVRVLDIVTPASVKRMLVAPMGGLVFSPLNPPAAVTAVWQSSLVAHVAPARTLAAAPDSVVLVPVAGGPPLVEISPAAPRPASGSADTAATTNGTGADSTATINGTAADSAATTSGNGAGARLPTTTSGNGAGARAPTTTSGNGAAAPGQATTSHNAASASSAGPEGGPEPRTRPAGDALDAVTSAGSPAAFETWTVQHGDNCWTIAKRVLSARIGRQATAAEIAPLWAALIAANRDQLRGAPSLIYPGERLVIPPAP
jgi:hypothetical protein